MIASPRKSEPCQDGTFEPLTRSDIPAVTDLLFKVFVKSEDQPQQKHYNYMERIFCDSPWADLEASPSILYRNAEGEILGFFGVHTRAFRFQDELVTGVAVGQYMVDPVLRRKGVARRLNDVVLAGPQTLTFTTSAAEAAAHIFRRSGYDNPPFGSTKWQVDLRPMSGRFSRVIEPVRQRLKKPSIDEQLRYGQLTVRPFADSSEWLGLRARLRDRFALTPLITERQAQWLWQQLNEGCARHVFRTCVVQDRQDVLGWALLFVTPGGTARIQEICCEDQRARDVIGACLYYGRRHGNKWMSGSCVNPQVTAAAVDLGARIVPVCSSFCVHSKNRDIQQVFANGQAFLSELDGESWVSVRNI